MKRVFNFSAGPCCLPEDVLLESQADLLNWGGTGQSVMEMSHRGKAFISIYRSAVQDLKDLLSVPDSHEILFMHGGATLQFAAVPLNVFEDKNSSADFVITGSWGKKAQEEAAKYCKTRISCDAAQFYNGKYLGVPPVSSWTVFEPQASYLHYCSNETIMGVEFHFTPDVNVPLVADMSSNFCTRPIDFGKHGIIYAGVQKNLGPASCAVVILDKSFLASRKRSPFCPTIMNYETMIKNESMYNTPPCWPIYMVGLMAKHLKKNGGIHAAEDRSIKKSQALYDFIDSFADGYYCASVEPASRSRMNVPFSVCFKNEEAENKFVMEAESKGLVNLAGHRSVGGCRASLYNAMDYDGVEKLIEFMKDFKESYPMPN